MKKILIACVLLCLTAAACKGKSGSPGKVLSGGANGGGPAYGDTLVEGTIGEPSILIPMLAGDSASHSVAGMIFNGLVKYDTDLSVIGDLAE